MLQLVEIGWRILQKANFLKSLAKKSPLIFNFFHNNIPIRKIHNNIEQFENEKFELFLGLRGSKCLPSSNYCIFHA